MVVPEAMEELSQARVEARNCGDIIEFLANDVVVHEAAKEWCYGKAEIVRTERYDQVFVQQFKLQATRTDSD